MKSISNTYSELTHASTGGPGPWVCLTIRHSALTAPIRVVNNTQDVRVDTHRYTALRFDIQLPDDKKGQQPRARLTVDNVGREMTQWLEASNGGEGAEATIAVVTPTDAGETELIMCHTEWAITLNLSNVSADMTTVSAELSFEDMLNLPAVALQYRPDVAPGIF